MGDDGARKGRNCLSCTKEAKCRQVMMRKGMWNNVAVWGRNRAVSTKGTEQQIDNDGAEAGREPGVCTMRTERRMGGIGAFVWCRRRKVYRLSENTLQTFWKNSIDFLEKLYRLSGKTLQTFLGHPIDFSPIPPYKRSDSLESTLRSHRTTAPSLRQKRARTYADVGLLVPVSVGKMHFGLENGAVGCVLYVRRRGSELIGGYRIFSICYDGF